MKRFLLVLALPLALAGCGGEPTAVSYHLNFQNAEAQMREDLTRTTLEIVDRRLEALGTAATDKSVETQTGATILHVTLPDATIAEALTAQLTEPFSLRIMKQVPDGQGMLKVEGHGEFAETDIAENDVIWGDSAADSEGKGAVRLSFTEDGRAKLAELFRTNVGNTIGIFVRERLISKLEIQSEMLDENIVIRNIPNPALAEVFVDDLNVGLHVTFTPLP